MRILANKQLEGIAIVKTLIIGLVLFAPAVILMSSVPAAPPPGDSVTGSGVAITGESFSIDASSNANGKGAGGTMTFSVTDPSALGNVTVKVHCLSVTGNVAFVGGRVMSSTSAAFQKNDGVRWFVRDDNDPDDLRIEPATTPVMCATAQTVSPIQSGGLTVVDN